MTVRAAMSTTLTVFSVACVTYACPPSGVTATAYEPEPVSTVAATVSLAVSISVTAPLLWLVTRTLLPSGSRATPAG